MNDYLHLLVFLGCIVLAISMVLWCVSWTYQCHAYMQGSGKYQSRLVVLEKGTKWFVMWTSPPQEFNPSMAWHIARDGGIQMEIVTRRSNMNMKHGGTSIVGMLKNRYFQTEDERVMHYSLSTHESKRNELIALDELKPARLKRPVYEDPRLFQFKPNEYAMFTTVFPKFGGHHLGLLHVDPTFERVTKVIPMQYPHGYVAKEKNWTFFHDRDRRLCVLTDLYPVVRVRNVNVWTGEHSIDSEWDSTKALPSALRCTSSPVRWDNSTLVLAAHTKDWIDKTICGIRTVWVWISDQSPFEIKAYSKQPIQFFDHSLIEYPSGLLTNPECDTYWLGLGHDDYHAHVLQLTRAFLEVDRVTVL